MKEILVLVLTLLMHHGAFAFTVSGVLYESVILPCDGAPRESEYYRWEKNGTGRIAIYQTNDAEGVLSYSDEFTGRLHIDWKTGDLTIRNVSWNDVALYSCWHNETGHSHDARIIGLTHTETYTLIPGEFLTLMCSGLPSKPTQFEWRKGSEHPTVIAKFDINSEPQQQLIDRYSAMVILPPSIGELIIYKLTEDNAGDIYSCSHERGVTTIILGLPLDTKSVSASTAESVGCGGLCITLTVCAAVLMMISVAATLLMIRSRKTSSNSMEMGAAGDLGDKTESELGEKTEGDSGVKDGISGVKDGISGVKDANYRVKDGDSRVKDANYRVKDGDSGLNKPPGVPGKKRVSLKIPRRGSRGNSRRKSSSGSLKKGRKGSATSVKRGKLSNAAGVSRSRSNSGARRRSKGFVKKRGSITRRRNSATGEAKQSDVHEISVVEIFL